MAVNPIRRAALLGWAVAAVPTAALAHAPIPGIGSFYSGALHPFVVPAQLMCIVCLGLLLGQRGLAASGRAAVAWIAGAALGTAAASAAGAPDTDRWLLGFTLVIGITVATVWRIRDWLVIALAGAAGLALGLGSAPDGLVGNAKWASLAGTWIGASIGVPWFASVVDAATRPWMKIGVRVLASWLVASSMLVLALSFVGPLPPRPERPPAASPHASQIGVATRRPSAGPSPALASGYSGIGIAATATCAHSRIAGQVSVPRASALAFSSCCRKPW